jgi:DNA modification methylase
MISSNSPKPEVRVRTRARTHVSAPALEGMAPALRNLRMEMISPEALKPYARNARRHSDKQIEQIAASIREFGFNNPVLVDAGGTIIAGHGRVEAGKRLGLAAVPVIRVDHLSDAQKRAYIIADNRLAELAGWDRELLAIELGELSTLDLDFDVEVTGFETGEIDVLIDGSKAQAKADPDDAVPAMPNEPAISRPGDLWLLGRHRLLCGNSLERRSYELLMPDEKARLVFTDPPYNVPIDGHVGGLGSVHHAEFAMASGEMSETEFTRFLQESLERMASVCDDGALLYCCMDWRHTFELQSAARANRLHQINLCVWVKDNGGMGSFYRSRHELVFVFRHGTAPHRNNVELGRHGRYRTNCWEYAGANTFRNGRLEELRDHPTPKPVALIADAIKDCSRRNEIVLDPFGGSGSTIIAAERTGRVARAIELEPRYVDVSIRRWQKLTRQDAVHAESGRTFAEITADRVEGGR